MSRNHTLALVSVLLGLGAIAQLFWIWHLPDALPTTSVEHRRGYFMFDMLFGAMIIVQSVNILAEAKRPGLRRAGGIFLAAGVLLVMFGISFAWHHMSGT